MEVNKASLWKHHPPGHHCQVDPILQLPTNCTPVVSFSIIYIDYIFYSVYLCFFDIASGGSWANYEAQEHV